MIKARKISRAETLRVDGSTVRRWLSGATHVPGPAMVALELLLTINGRERERKTTAGANGSADEKQDGRD